MFLPVYAMNSVTSQSNRVSARHKQRNSAVPIGSNLIARVSKTLANGLSFCLVQKDLVTKGIGRFGSWGKKEVFWRGGGIGDRYRGRARSAAQP
jgi:hypothetical protein